MSFLAARSLQSAPLPVLAPVLALVLALSLLSGSGFAQSGAGSIEGTIVDATGAVIPGASIHVVNQATGVAVDAKTNHAGFYQLPGLFTGSYTVAITAPGMNTFTRTIELLVAQDAIVNATLGTGAVTQQVSVSAGTAELETTDNGSITATLENARINELPMNTRNLVSLVSEATPGFESCPETASCANGQEGPAIEYEVDGATLANREFGGVHQGQNQMIDPDAIQEVRVEDAVSGARYAAPATAILSTKSGTNQLHGSAFWTARNNGFGLAHVRTDLPTARPPKLVRNEAGVSLGGPVVLPGLYHGKDRTFFFGAYERYSLAQIISQSETTPTAAMRNGDFSGLTNSAGVFQQLYDPNSTYNTGGDNCPLPPGFTGTPVPSSYCRTPFANNQIPAARESPLTALLNQMTPLPTNDNNPLVKSNLTGLDPESTIEPQITARLDHEFNENSRAYLRYTQNLTNAIAPRNDPVDESYTLAATTPSGFTFPAGVSGISNTVTHVYAASLGFTHVFSPTFFSETVYGQTWYGEANNAGGNPFQDYETEMGLPNNFGEQGFPYVESIFQPLDGTQFQYAVTTTTNNLDENLTRTMGRHQLEFGGRLRLEHFGSRPDQIKDSVVFNGQGTALLNPSTLSASTPTAYGNSGQLNADEFIGAASSYGVNLEPPYQHIHDLETDLYIQDNYRVRRNLTLNLGLRYEAHPAAWVGQGQMMGFDLKNDAIVTSGSLAQLEAEGLTTAAIIQNDMLDGARFETPADASLPRMLVNSYDFTWGPRFGAAWQPFRGRETVVRGGVGRYIYPIPIREGYREVNRNNPFTASYSESYTSVQYTPQNGYLLLAPQSTSPTYSWSDTLAGGGTPVMGLNSTQAVNSSTPGAIKPGIGIVSMNPDSPPTYVQEADLTVEQPLEWSSVVRMSYLYTHGTNLNNYFYYNDHPSAYAWEVQTGTAPPSSSALGPTNSSTGEGPYDNLTYGSGSYQINKSGWSNYNALQAAWQRLYHNGSAWQIMYVWSRSMRTGGDFGGSAGEYVNPYSAYINTYEGSGASPVSVAPAPFNTLIPPALPPPPPAGTPRWGYYKALNRWENYMVDSFNPPHHIQFNGLVDLPFGRGRLLMGSAGKAVDAVVGHWQLAGAGSVLRTTFPIASTMWGPPNPNSPGHPLKVYKRAAPITDCRGGHCVKGYDWWNGYIAPTAVSGNLCAGDLAAVVTGLPAGWQPFQTPGDVQCSPPSNGKTVVDTYYGGNEVIMNGVAGLKANTPVAYGIVPSNNDNGSSGGTIDVTNPFAHTVLNGPFNWNADASLFKTFPVGERMNVRLNLDAFNVFNHQGMPNPSGTDGTVCVTPGGVGCKSANSGRNLQFSLRINY